MHTHAPHHLPGLGNKRIFLSQRQESVDTEVTRNQTAGPGIGTVSCTPGQRVGVRRAPRHGWVTSPLQGLSLRNHGAVPTDFLKKKKSVGFSLSQR